MGSLIAIGGALGPFLAGLAYDYTGSYNMFVILGMIGCFLAGLLILTLPRCPEWDTAPSDRPKQDRAVLLEENA
jgi:MFS family permease